MEFDIRKNTRYLNVKVTEGRTVIDLGVLDDRERIELARQLKEAIDELLEGIDIEA